MYKSLRSGFYTSDDGACHSPTSPQYLSWLAEGNTPLPPDPPSKAELDAPVLAALEALDRKSIRGLREWVAKQADAPKELADLETSATAERAKLKEP